MMTMRKFLLFLLIISITSETNAKTAIARDVPANRGPSYQEHAQKTLSSVQPRKMTSSRNTSESIQMNSNIGHIMPKENSDEIVENNSKSIPAESLKVLRNELPLPTHVSPSEIFRFELSDAAIPNKETAELINQGRVRLSKHEQQEHQTDHQRDMFTEESRASHQIQAATQKEQPAIINYENRKAKSISELGYSNQAHAAVPRYGYMRYQAVPVKLFNPNQKENSYQQWWKQPAKHVNPYKNYRPTFKPFSPSIEYPNSNAKYQKNNLYEYKFESPPSETTQYQPNSQYSFKPSAYDNLYHNPIPFVIEVPDKKIEYTAANYLHSQTEALTQLIGKPATQQLQGLSNLLQYDHPQRQQDSTAPVLFPLGARLPKPKENQTESILNLKKIVATEAPPAEVPQEEAVSYALVPYYLHEDQKPIIEETMEEEVTNVHQPILPSIPVELPAPQEPPLIFHELSPLPKDLNKPYASGYKFGYRVRDHHTGNDFGHTQNRDTDGVTRGEYHTLLPDGRLQTVWYTADKKGFHADVSYNGEPPTKHADG